MNWYVKHFSAHDVSQGYDKKMEKFLLGVIFDKESFFIEDEDLVHRARFAAYRAAKDANGAFTSYFTEAIVNDYPHLETNLEPCDRPDAAVVKTWIGIEPMAFRLLQET